MILQRRQWHLFAILIVVLTLRFSSATNTTQHSRRLPTSPRIVGGSAAPLGAYPGFAHWSTGCGATLITPQILLTAAHCYMGSPGIIRVGSIQRNQGTTFAVRDQRIHPRFNGNRNEPDWDVMILKLWDEVPASVATPVALNSNANIPVDAGDPLVAVGFGRLEEGGKSDSDTLQEVSLPYVPDIQCSQAYNNGRINEATVCAGQAGIDACQGDSGGPLFSAGQPNLQVGIVSWGMGCARPNFPGVYARVSTMFPWIQGQSCLLSDNPPETFCQDASLPIGLSLQVEMDLDPVLYQNYSWGLYHVEDLTTLYQSEEEHGIVTEVVNTAATGTGTAAASRQASIRKKDTDQPTEEQEDLQLGPNNIRLQWDNVLPGTYYFTLRNAVRTGLPSADNKIWINQGDSRRVVTVPHDFAGVYTQYFHVSNQQLVSEMRKQQDPPPPTVDLTVDVFYDANPQETAWELRNLDTGEVLAFIAAGSIEESKYDSYTYTVPRVGHHYRLKLRDTSGNGMSNGWMSLWIGLDMVWKSDQNNSTTPFAFETSVIVDV